MNILVFGAGAVGSLLGGFLAKAGHRVYLLGRAPHMQVIAERGLRIRGIWGKHVISNLELFTETDTLFRKKILFDLVLFTVKSFDTEVAIKQAARFLEKRTTLISFQNGLGNIEKITQVVGRDHYLAGRIITGVKLVPGEITVTVSADVLAIGALPQSKPLLPPVELVRLFNQAHIPAREAAHILQPIWSKVIYNCALNAPCSVWEIPYGAMLETPERKNMMRRIVEECYAVADAHEITLEPPNAHAYFQLLISELIPKTSGHFPSMLEDLRRGRQTEIESLNGAIVRMGRTAGVATPENEGVAERVCAKGKIAQAGQSWEK